MQPVNRFVELERNWTPPDGLDRSLPREVRLTGAGKGVLALAVVLFAGALAAAIGLRTVADRQVERQRQLQEHGADTEGVVTRLWRERGKSPQSWIAYRFTVQGTIYDQRSRAPLRVWRELREGSVLPVRYLPANPALSYPLGCEERPMPGWLPYFAGLALAALSGLVAWSVQCQKRLLAEGRAAPALVTRHTRADHGKKRIHYDFPLLSGSAGKGKGGPTRNPAPVGAQICVVYDPDNPRRNAPYPFTLVRPAVETSCLVARGRTGSSAAYPG